MVDLGKTLIHLRVVWHKWRKQGPVEIFRNCPCFDEKEGRRTCERRIGREEGREGGRERNREKKRQKERERSCTN